MGQAEVQAFFEQHPDEWFTPTQLAEATGVNRGSINDAIARMNKYHELEMRTSKLNDTNYTVREWKLR